MLGEMEIRGQAVCFEVKERIMSIENELVVQDYEKRRKEGN